MSDGLCQCGCGRRTKIAQKTVRRRGVLKGEPLRFVNGHNPVKLWDNFEEDSTTGCWLWIGAKTTDGYGQVSLAERSTLAYRVVYEDMVGPVPEDLELDHLCETPACVNPGHLEPVTHRVNMLRGSRNAAGRNARKTHCPQGHPLDGTLSTGQRYCLECNRQRARENYRRSKAAA